MGAAIIDCGPKAPAKGRFPAVPGDASPQSSKRFAPISDRGRKMDAPQHPHVESAVKAVDSAREKSSGES